MRWHLENHIWWRPCNAAGPGQAANPTRASLSSWPPNTLSCCISTRAFSRRQIQHSTLVTSRYTLSQQQGSRLGLDIFPKMLKSLTPVCFKGIKRKLVLWTGTYEKSFCPWYCPLTPWYSKSRFSLCCSLGDDLLERQISWQVHPGKLEAITNGTYDCQY